MSDSLFAPPGALVSWPLDAYHRRNLDPENQQ